MSNLDTRTKQFNIVLNLPYGVDLTQFNSRLLNLTDYFNRQCYMFAMILHNKDKDSKGNLKTIHWHIVLKTTSINRASTILYKIADNLNYSGDQINTISIEKCDSIPASIQYLTHKNNKDKAQYDYKDIITNLSISVLEDYYNSLADNTITAKLLTDMILAGDSDFVIMNKIGLGRYHLYKGAISDIRYAISNRPHEVADFLNSVDIQK